LPELPEVQTVVNSLQKATSKQIESFTPYWDKICYNKNSSLITNKIKNKSIKKIYRIGKYIIIQLNIDYIIFHLRMTGYLYHSKSLKKNNHTRCHFKLNNSTYLIYEDIRKFGGFYYDKNLNFVKNKIGIDPILDKNFTLKWLNANLKMKSRQLKSLLLDQKFICGLGNIYIDEILWKSKLHPKALSSSLNNKSTKLLFKSILKILNDSLQHHGTTIINFKFDNMRTGNYKNKLKVYSRENKECTTCQSLIIKLKVSSRGTYICPKCQKYS